MLTLEHDAGGLSDWLRGHAEPDLPVVKPTPETALKWLTDELSVQFEFSTSLLRRPDADFRSRMRDELAAARNFYEQMGWFNDPGAYHRTPPDQLSNLSISRASTASIEFDHLRFASEFEPWPDEPGRDRWLGYEQVHTGHAWMLEHAGPARPWIVLVNGYRTGDPKLDFGMFRAMRLHRHHGLNVAGVVLPLHGPRAVGTSGSRVLYAGVMNTLYTMTQAAWDIRRFVRYLRNQHDAAQIGISGISLGGFAVALVAGLEPDLSCVIAGVPESDLVRGFRRQVEPLLPTFYEQWGLSWEPLERVFGLVSPLSFPCLVPVDRRFIYAGLVDRWVRPGNVQTLWRHWEEPDIHWYPGSHLSFPFERSVSRFVDQAVESSFGFDPSLVDQ